MLIAGRSVISGPRLESNTIVMSVEIINTTLRTFNPRKLKTRYVFLSSVSSWVVAAAYN
jgi:hypothetical protein